MEQFKFFNQEKQALVSSLLDVKGVVGRLEEVGLDIQDDLQKIEHAIENIESGVLRIALIGAFSDGKTSVIAGWLGQVLDDMKIDTNESSDELLIYHPEGLPERCEIVDTPGLFGDKEKEDARGNKVCLGEMTRKYLSEAHLVFYVVDATNPLKDSHKETVKWILRDLNKLPTTIFVLNKMDEVADLRDEEAFAQQAEIKKANISEKIARYVGLSADEQNALNIVCLAANPNERGLDFWFGKRDMYEERSRIGALQRITHEIIHTSTRQELLKKTGFDVIQDVVANKMEDATNEFAAMELFADQSRQEISRIEEEIMHGRGQVIEAKKDLFEELDDIEKQLLSKSRALSAEDIHGFLEDEIGLNGEDVGYKLQLRIQTTAESCFNQATAIMDNIGASIEAQLDTSEKFASTLGTAAGRQAGHAFKVVSKMPVDKVKSGVFAARDMIGKITGKVFKFPPWGADKIAKVIGKWAGPAGAGLHVAMDVADKVKQQKREAELAEVKVEIAKLIKDHFKTVYDALADTGKTIETFAPRLLAFEDILAQQKEGLAEIEAGQKLLGEIRSDFEKCIAHETVEAEFVEC